MPWFKKNKEKKEQEEKEKQERLRKEEEKEREEKERQRREEEEKAQAERERKEREEREREERERAVKKEKEEKGFLGRLKERLSKTREGFVGRVDRLVLGKKKIDDDLLEELEEILITSDIGVQPTFRLIENLRDRVKRKELDDADLLKKYLQEEILKVLKAEELPLEISDSRPFVILVVGVNGVGKTTTIAKMAGMFKDKGKSVLLAAGDTFRAAAIEQLEIWGERAGCKVIK
ncbi:MAG: signal recognition particle receptor subunit alpha, partial [Thermodesulfobacteriota bacterium]|nr:signal recognition particle receptor subunit alpha [Thermodesulfobacteriota bacterium]